MFLEVSGIKDAFLKKLSSSSDFAKQNAKYIACMIAKDCLQEFDRTSQIISYHYLKGVDIGITSTVTSLSKNKVIQVLDQNITSFVNGIESYDLDSLMAHFFDEKRIIDDLLSSKPDIEIVNKYGEEIAIVKNLRIISDFLFNAWSDASKRLA
jgi:hypothetical protein